MAVITGEQARVEPWDKDFEWKQIMQKVLIELNVS